MALTEKQRHDLKKFIKELESYRGRHTEFVSVLIPQDYDIIKVIQHLQQEQGTATNIKSSATRKNVIDALEKMIQHLKLFKRTPPNGLAAYSGNLASAEGQNDVRVWSVEPPIAIKTRLYRCDKDFKLDILKEMLDVRDVYALIVLDRRDANIALLKGKSIIHLLKTHSEVPGKFRAGGQCLWSESLIQMADGQIKEIKDVEIGEGVISLIDKEEGVFGNSVVVDKWVRVKKEIYKIITKNPKNEIKCSADHTFFLLEEGKIVEKQASSLSKNDTLVTTRIKSKRFEDIEIIPNIIDSINNDNEQGDLVDISVNDGNFIAQNILVHNSAPRFARLREGAAKEHYNKVAEYAKEQLLHMEGLKGIIVGGPGPTKYEFVEGGYLTNELKKKIIAIKDLSYTEEFGVEELLERSSDVLANEEVAKEKQLMADFFDKLAKKPGLVTYGKKECFEKLKMGMVDKILISDAVDDSIIQEFEDESVNYGSSVFLISVDTREGVQLKEIGGIAAVLRYDAA